MTNRDVGPDEMPNDPIDAFFDDLRSAAADAPPPVVGNALRTLFREGADPVTTAATPARRRRWSWRAGAAGVVASIAFGGLGAAGALPRPVQHGVAEVGRHVGLELPDPETTTTTAVPVTKSTVAPRTSSTTDDRSGRDDSSTTIEPGADRRGSNRGESGDEHGRSSDGDRSGKPSATTTTTADDGSRERRNPAANGDVHSEDGPQAAGRHANSGGQSE